KTNGIMGRPRSDLIENLIDETNICLILKRARLLGKEKTFNHCFISKIIADKNYLSDQSYCFPIYYFNKKTNTNRDLLEDNEIFTNFNINIISKIENRINCQFLFEKEKKRNTFTSIDILDYIYAVLHSPKYRETYKEFLKIDFPRVPYPTDQKQFWDLVALGKQIREIHLLESPKVEDFISSYPVEGTNIVVKPKYAEG